MDRIGTGHLRMTTWSYMTPRDFPVRALRADEVLDISSVDYPLHRGRFGLYLRFAGFRWPQDSKSSYTSHALTALSLFRLN